MSTPPIPTVSLAEATGALLGEPPRESEMADSTPAAQPPPPAGGLPGAEVAVQPGDLDSSKVPWDPARHHPRKHPSNGQWVRKRGNAQVKADGRPIPGAAGRRSQFVPPPAAQEPQENGQNPQGGPNPAAEGQGKAADSGAVDGVPLDPSDPGPDALRPEDYAGTATALAGAMFGMARITIGQRWEPEAAEAKAWQDALARLWAEYQLPRVGPVVEVIVLGVTSTAKRADDPATQRAGRWIRGLWDRTLRWVGLRSGPRAVETVPPPTTKTQEDQP